MFIFVTMKGCNHTKRILISLLLIISIPQISNSQVIKGRITNPSGNAIPYATVYIRELKQGTISNTNGNYEIKLPAGKYLVTYQSLGYEPVSFDVTITDKTVVRDIILPLQYYQIPEVKITASGEDPAYGIMRKAIGLAPYYLNHVSYYKADVYLKGDLVIDRIPKLLKKTLKAESSSDDQKPLKEGGTYLMESYNEIEFSAPDKYVQRVLSSQSSFPEEGNGVSPMDFIKASFYEPVLAGMAISPISPQAFTYYKFKYLGATLQGKFIINKIEVIPKRKSQQLFYGTIFIIDDLWCLQSIDLKNDNLAGKIRIQQLYVPVQDNIWMPVSHKFEINISIMGFKAEAGYVSSVKYLEVRPNNSLPAPISEASDYTSIYNKKDTSVSKTKEQIENILRKDELSNRDMQKLSRLLNKESENSIPDTLRKSLEIKDNTIKIVDKDATRKDSAYWANVRPVPLSEIELKSLHVRDSLRALSLRQMKNDTLDQGKDKQKSNFSRSFKNIAFGHTWSDTSGFSFRNGGLIDLKKLNFNTVDGFVYGVSLRLSRTWGKKNTLSFYPDFRWSFSRKTLMWIINGNYRIGGMNQKMISFRAGMTSKDINTNGSINSLLNSFTTLFLKKNYLKLYGSGYFGLGYRMEIVNGVSLEFNGNFEDRRVLDNTTDFSISKSSKKYSENIPDNEYLATGSNPLNALSDMRHVDFVTNVTYIPFQRYKINNNNKIPMGSDWPTFSLTWKHGINEFTGMSVKYQHFDMIRFEVNNKIETGAFSEFTWRVRTGGFLDNTNLPYYDFFHFNAQPLPLLIDNYQDAFMLPEYYSLSSPEFFGEAHIKYTTPYLLLKLLPGLSKTLMRENITFSYLGTRFHKNYSELGYSISGILFVGELGFYAGFEDISLKSLGAKLILRLN